MTQALQRRLKSLEDSNPQSWRWVWVNDGETKEQARQRADVGDDERVIYFSWLDELL